MVNKCGFLSGRIAFSFELKLLTSAMHQTNSLFNLDCLAGHDCIFLMFGVRDAFSEVLGSLRWSKLKLYIEQMKWHPDKEQCRVGRPDLLNTWIL